MNVDVLRNNPVVRILVGIIAVSSGLYTIVALFGAEYEVYMYPALAPFIFIGMIVFRGGLGLVLNKKRINILDYCIGSIFTLFALYMFLMGVILTVHDFSQRTGLGMAFGMVFAAVGIGIAIVASRFLNIKLPSKPVEK